MPQLPNCEICLWRIIVVGKTAADMTLIENMPYPFCSAQGHMLCSEAYGNKHCKKLFKTKEIEKDASV